MGIIPAFEQPKYELTLPSTKEKIVYRPFTVKEEKILLLALEEENEQRYAQALGQIIDLCTFGKCELLKMTKVDVEYLFINIRNKSLGEGLDVRHKCVACDKQNEMSLDLSFIEVIEKKDVSNKIKLSEKVLVQMSYPSLEVSLSDADTNTNIAKCIDIICVADDVYVKDETNLNDFIEFIETLGQNELKLIDEFFDSMPKVIFRSEYTCKCGQKNIIVVEGLNNFFD